LLKKHFHLKLVSEQTEMLQLIFHVLLRYIND